MWKFKKCPRCMGDVFLDRDFEGGWYEQCLQCGHRRYMPVMMEARRDSARKKLSGNKKRKKATNAVRVA